MSKYLISFNQDDMDFPEEDFPAISEAVRALRSEGEATGAWIFSGGFPDFSPRVVGVDGSVKDGALAESKVHLGGFTVIDAASDEEALDWAKKIAVACRCDQEIRKFIEASK